MLGFHFNAVKESDSHSSSRPFLLKGLYTCRFMLRRQRVCSCCFFIYQNKKDPDALRLLEGSDPFLKSTPIQLAICANFHSTKLLTDFKKIHSDFKKIGNV